MPKTLTKDPVPTPAKDASGKSPVVRIASKEQFDKVLRKTLTEHAELFRRLAK